MILIENILTSIIRNVFANTVFINLLPASPDVSRK